jgi:hypothetical protein
MRGSDTLLTIIASSISIKNDKYWKAKRKEEGNRTEQHYYSNEPK